MTLSTLQGQAKEGKNLVMFFFFQYGGNGCSITFVNQKDSKLNEIF